MKIPRIIAILAAATAMQAGAQINSPAAPGYFTRGTAMFTDANYIGALQQLEQAARSRALTDNEQSRLEYLRAMSVFHTRGAADAEPLLKEWLLNWPASTCRADVMMSLADCLFTQNYAEALKAYQEINPEALSTDALRLDLKYRKAYCLLKVGEYDKADALFGQLAYGGKYRNAALFYQGYIQYAKGNNAAAQQAFNKVDRNTEPGNMADYYLSQIYYKEGNYSRALQTAQQILSGRDMSLPYHTHSGADKSLIAEANRIAGESLFQLGDTGQAGPYLQKYVDSVENPLGSALYILGLDQYNNGNYAKAAEYFKPATAEQSAMGQNAYLYLGQSLLHQGDTDGAIMAFDRALRMNFDNTAAENAYFNYAVAKYAGGNVPFGSSVKVFEDFLTRYPASTHADEVRQYIVAGYLTDNNYQAALDAINRAKNPSGQILAAKQRVLYTLGTRDLATGNIPQAIKRLSEAKQLGAHNPEYARETLLSLGEAYLRDGRYNEAITELKSYLSNKATGTSQAHNRAVANIDLGYAYMGNHDWNDAATAFTNALKASGSNLDKATLADIRNRLGDCNLYLKDWEGAIKNYQTAYNTQPETGDYALFQMAMANGYAGRYLDKSMNLESLTADYPTSSLVPEAMLENTEALLRLERTDRALNIWEELISRYPNTPQGRQAYLQMALTYTDLGRTADAEKAYRDIIAKYPTSDEAAQAAEILKQQAANQGTLDQYMQFIAGIENAPQIDASEAERLTWQAARAQADDKGDYSRIADYLTRYPNGKYASTATAMMLRQAADAGNRDAALGYARKLLAQWPDNSEAATAYRIVALADEDAGRGEDALLNWQKAESHATTPAQANLARQGLMRVARDTRNTAEMSRAAKAILASSANVSDLRTEAVYTLGLAQLTDGNAAEAMSTWTPISTLTNSEYGAKAAVALAEAQLAAGDAKAARKTAQAFTDSDTPHTYWLARGFIVLSDALRSLGEKYDADEYLRALRENYPGSEADIFTMIDERLGK